MRILQVVTLLSPDGAYGGPARVALNQSAELIDRGNDVTVAAATHGFDVVPEAIDGVPVKLFAERTLIPRTGFAGMGAPALTTWFRANRTRFDMVHIHFGRDLVVLPVAAARRHQIPYVLQTHGMVVPSRHPLAAPLDAVWTRKLLREAAAVFYLSREERAALVAVAGEQLRLRELPNGVPEYPSAAPAAGPPEVLFAARMHKRKRPLVFVEMARKLLAEGVRARFTLLGPDAGEGPAIRAALAGESRISWDGAVSPADLPGRLAAATVFVLPAVAEPYPMAVLEAMSVGLPVIVCADCGLAPLVRRARCGAVVDHDVTALVAAVRDVLADPALARAMGERARAAVHAECSMHAVGDRLLDTYAEAVRFTR